MYNRCGVAAFSEKRLAALQQIPGWGWTVHEDKWQHRLHELSTWANKHNGIPSKRSNNRLEALLGYWCSNQRIRNAKGRLPVGRAKDLEIIPAWYWSIRTHKWDIQFKALARWARVEGCLPRNKSKSEEGQLLYNWITRQNRLRRKNELSKVQIEKLESTPGWVWPNPQDQWDRTFSKLCAWANVHGRLPSAASKDKVAKQLGMWCSTQHRRKKQGFISADQMAQLEGFRFWAWDPLEARWLDTLKNVAAWSVAHQGLPSAGKAKSQEERSLSSWCVRQRSLFRAGMLSAARAVQLDSIPLWDWSPPYNRPKPSYNTTKKLVARDDTIVKLYRKVFRRKRLPEVQQYWSMSAQCVDQGTIIKDSELHQLMKTKLIQPEQFHGIDHDPQIYQANCTDDYSSWYCGDVHDVLTLEADEPDFNPGVINVDTTHEPERGVELFCKILGRLKHVNNCLFVGNFVVKNRGRVSSVDDIVCQLEQNKRFRRVAPTLQWDARKTFYWYQGATTQNRTEMCTVMMWRK